MARTAKTAIIAPAITPALDFLAGVELEPDPEPVPDPEFLATRGAKRASIDFEEKPSIGSF
jgi:hypothetical protein